MRLFEQFVLLTHLECGRDVPVGIILATLEGLTFLRGSPVLEQVEQPDLLEEGRVLLHDRLVICLSRVDQPVDLLLRGDHNIIISTGPSKVYKRIQESYMGAFRNRNKKKKMTYEDKKVKQDETQKKIKKDYV